MTLPEIAAAAGIAAVAALALIALTIERLRRAVRSLNVTIANAAVAQFKAQLAESGGTMQFTRLSERARGGRRGEEAKQEAEE